MALASTGVSFTSYPSHTINQNKWIVRDVNAGAEYQDQLTVENLSDQEITLDIKTIETTGAEENIRLLENQPAKNAGNWIKSSESQVTLAAHQKKQITLNINIPPQTKLGKYQAAVLVSNKISSDSAVNLTSRIGNRIYLNVTDSKVIQSNVFNSPLGSHQIVLIIASLMGIVISSVSLSRDHKKTAI
ncbi:DUF916 domain-containing protein [Candidatus Peregrinibacteria bacterium]|nr:DUF916 domain-containing protein [Candidatus Peregrinibacteria bacterium]